MKTIALIAHDNLKPALVEWAKVHRDKLSQYLLVATGTTGSLIEKEVKLKVERVKSGPLGGDLQIGSKLVEGNVDLCIFFWDPLSPHPHDVDVKALLRVAAVYNIPIACNQASADLMILVF